MRAAGRCLVYRKQDLCQAVGSRAGSRNNVQKEPADAVPLRAQEPGEKLAKGPRKRAGSSDGSSVQQLQRVLEVLGTSSVVRLSFSSSRYMLKRESLRVEF